MAVAPPAKDLARIEQYCKDAVPAHLHDKKRVEMTRRGTSVTIWECDAPEVMHTPDWFRVAVARLRYDAEANKWTLYWPDRNSRFHKYEFIQPSSIDKLLREIDDDPTCIFWG